MKIDVNVDATANEKRRFLGSPDVTTLIELVSVMLDEAMMVVVDARLKALETSAAVSEIGEAQQKIHIDPLEPVQQRRRS